MNNAEILKKHSEYLFPSVITYYKEALPLVRGDGKYLYDADGREYLDFFGGIVTVSVGHCHPEVVARVTEQAATLVHTSTLFPTVPMVQLAERLAQIAPGNLRRSFFTASGTEADETAILLARHYTQRNEVIALRHAYAGRSSLAMSITAHSAWRLNQNTDGGIRHALSPYCYRCPLHLKYPDCGIACAKDIEELIQTTTTGKIAAFIAEPIQGVGGFITPPKEYFEVAVEIIRRYGGLFIADEVQTGFGRTGGKWWGIEQYGVTPDIMTCAKGIANGFPLSATISSDDVASRLTGLTISTFGGNPVSCSAALAVLDVIEKENLLTNTKVVGDHLRKGLLALQEKYPVIGDVRGMGLMQAIELVKDRKTKEPAKEAVGQLFEETRKRGLIIGKGGLYGNVIRISPPMNVTKADVDTFLKIVDQSMAVVK